MAKEETQAEATGNMALWNRHRVSDKTKLKEVTFGRKFNSIDAHSQLMAASEEWGPLGWKWGWRGKVDVTYVHGPDGTEMDMVGQCLFWYECEDGPKGEYPVLDNIEIWHEKEEKDRDGNVTIKRVYNNEYAKKLLTSMRSKALSMLGFNSDVFEGQHDSRYVDRGAGRAAPTNAPAPAAPAPQRRASAPAATSAPKAERPFNPPQPGGTAITPKMVEKFLPPAIGRAEKKGWTREQRHAALDMCGVGDWAELNFDQCSWLFGRHANPKTGKVYRDLPEMDGLFEAPPPEGFGSSSGGTTPAAPTSIPAYDAMHCIECPNEMEHGGCWLDGTHELDGTEEPCPRLGGK